MFSTQKGPLIMEQGPSYIHLQNDFRIYTARNITPKIAYAIFSPEESNVHSNLEGMCDGDTYRNEWAALVDTRRVSTHYHGKVKLLDIARGINGSYYSWTTTVQRKYTVVLEAWHNVAFQVCPALDAGMVMATINGQIVFRNPYGFLPAELYGFLPFEGARMVALVLFGLVFLVLYMRHRESALHLHHAILAVVLISVVEASTWFTAYHLLNQSGEPYCCPFPSPVVASLVLQVFRQTFSRTLLLVVSLGYGIVRPKLMATEWVAVFIVTFLYFVTACVSAVAEIILVHDVHGNAPKSVFMYQTPALMMDVIFLSWIYLALTSTIRILTEFQQTVKLNMYHQLAVTIGVFVVLYGVVAGLILLDDMDVVTWPWQWLWVQQVLWEVLNFATLACVCIVCRPSEHSSLLSYASQLPTSDPDEDEEGGVRGPDSMEDEEEDEETHGQRMTMAGFGRSTAMDVSMRGPPDDDLDFMSLPEADDGHLELRKL